MGRDSDDVACGSAYYRMMTEFPSKEPRERKRPPLPTRQSDGICLGCYRKHGAAEPCYVAPPPFSEIEILRAENKRLIARIAELEKSRGKYEERFNCLKQQIKCERKIDQIKASGDWNRMGRELEALKAGLTELAYLEDLDKE